MEERLRRVIKCGCSLRSKPVVAAHLGPVSQVQDTTSLCEVCSHRALNLRESVFVLLQLVNVWTTKDVWKFCSAFSEDKLLLHCSEPGKAVAVPVGGGWTKNSGHLVPVKQAKAFIVRE